MQEPGDRLPGLLGQLAAGAQHRSRGAVAAAGGELAAEHHVARFAPRHQTGKPETSEVFRPVTEYLADDSTIIAFKLVGLDPGWTYQVLWVYK